jgi:hypothetical protein
MVASVAGVSGGATVAGGIFAETGISPPPVKLASRAFPAGMENEA